MILNDIVQDIYTLEDEVRVYERKYGVLSETFFESYQAGEEPLDESWVRDWSAWAGAYQLYLERRMQYETLVKELGFENTQEGSKKIQSNPQSPSF